MNNIPDHPEIRSAERTGYPSWMDDDCFCVDEDFLDDEE